MKKHPNGKSIEWCNVSELKQHPKNPRVIKDKPFAKLVRSLKKFPEMLILRPVVYVETDGVKHILGGNKRTLAAIEAGLTRVPVVNASNFTEEQQEEFLIKDNVQSGEWDFDILGNQFDFTDVDDWGLDVPEMKSTRTRKDAQSQEYQPKYKIVITLENEHQQAQALTKLEAEGYICELLTL